jgi:hypothetical protein
MVKLEELNKVPRATPPVNSHPASASDSGMWSTHHAISILMLVPKHIVRASNYVRCGREIANLDRKLSFCTCRN